MLCYPKDLDRRVNRPIRLQAYAALVILGEGLVPDEEVSDRLPCTITFDTDRMKVEVEPQLSFKALKAGTVILRFFTSPTGSMAHCDLLHRMLDEQGETVVIPHQSIC